jgi:hypothetical protein
MPIGKIICIGDSLTAGDESNPIGYRSYRGALQLLLQNAGYTVDFVGTQSSTPATGGDDPEHDGYGGARMDSSDSAGNSIEGRIATIRTAVGAVDIIILFIGWNDVYQSTASAATKYSDLLVTIRAGTWSTAQIVMVTLSPEPNKTPAQTGSDYPVYGQINSQIALEADANHIVADLAALTGSTEADRNTMVEKLLYDALNGPEVTTRANGQGIPSVGGGHYITSFRSIQDYNANWRTTVSERRGVNGSTAGLAPNTSHVGHPYFVNAVNACVPWLWVFAGPGHASNNTVVESRNLFAQALRGSNNQWEFFFEGARTGATDSNSSVYDLGHPQALRGFRPDGLTSFYRTGGGTNIEAWANDTVPSRGISQFSGGTNRALMADAKCFVVGVQVRLALLDPSGTNDMQSSRFVVACGWDAFAGAPYRYDYWGWPYEMMDGGHDRWQILRATDWSWIGSVTMDRGSGHFEDPAVPPPHEQGYPYAHPYNDYPTYSKSAAEIRANPFRLPQYYSSSSSSSGWVAEDYWLNPTLGARDIHWSQQGADKAARVVYDRMVSAGWLSTFVGGGAIDAQLLPGIPAAAMWWPRFTTEATDPDTADWESGGLVQPVAPTWQTETLPNAITSAAYSAVVSALGTPAPTYTKVSGPAWLAVNSTTGALTGTADATPASVAVVLRATNSAGVADVSLTLLLREGLSITTSALPVFVVDVPYALQVQTAGAQPIEFSATGLPAGVAMSASGVISGTPTTASSGSVVVTATNPDNTATRTISWQVAAAASLPDITTSSLPSGTVGTAYLAEIAATGTQPITYGAAGVPAGLALVAGTRNVIANAAMIGAGVGVEPPQWDVGPTYDGLAISIVGVGEGTIPGVPYPLRYIDIRAQGTTAQPFTFLVGSMNVAFPAVAGQTWTLGAYVQNIAGTRPGTRLALRILYLDSSFAGLDTSNTTLTSSALSLTSVTGNPAPATTAYVVGQMFVDGFAPGQVVDFTTRLYMPQLVQESSLGALMDPRYAYISGTPTAPGFYVLAVTATNSLDTDAAALALSINPAAVVSASQSGGWGKFIRQ